MLLMSVQNDRQYKCKSSKLCVVQEKQGYVELVINLYTCNDLISVYKCLLVRSNFYGISYVCTILELYLNLRKSRIIISVLQYSLKNFSLLFCFSLLSLHFCSQRTMWRVLLVVSSACFSSGISNVELIVGLYFASCPLPDLCIDKMAKNLTGWHGHSSL